MNILDKQKGKEVPPIKPYKYVEVRKRLAAVLETLKRREEKLEFLQAEIDFLKKRRDMYKTKIGLPIDN